MGQKANEEDVELDFNRVKDGIVIEFGPEASFEPGSHEVSAELTERLTDVGRVLENYPHMVVVEGFTDGSFQPTPRMPDAEAMSVARASAAAEVLLSTTSMNPDLVQLSGHGATRPRADDVSVSGRRLNRRVQVRVLALSKVRASYLESKSSRSGATSPPQEQR